jgi:hypothetical protein
MSDVFSNLDPLCEIVCLILQDYFMKKGCTNLLGWVFIMNNRNMYIDFKRMNVEIAVFEGNNVVVGVNTVDADQNKLQPYQMFVVREGFKRAFYKREVYYATSLGMTQERILLEVETI